MPEEKHIPGVDIEGPAADAPAPDGDKAPEAEPAKPDGEAAKPADDEPKPEDKPEDKKPDEPPAPLLKKRSIYDDLKDERTKRKDAEAEVARLKGETPPEKPADPAPSKPEKPATELEQFAKDNEVDPAVISRLAEIVAKSIPTSQLSDEDKEALADVKTWRAQQARTQEDNDVLATAPSVKTQLNVSDDTELQNVMKEVVRLSHTPEFHDKEVDYIVWKNRDALAKLVSPKKPSFEQGGQPGDAAADAAVDFSKGGVTPEMAGKAMTEKQGSALEIRPSK